MKLRDVLPSEALSVEFSEDKFQRYLDSEVIETITKYDSRFPFTHKNIYVWWILKDNMAVGWNENPSRGWSFPVAKLKKEDKKVTMKLTLLVYTCPECDYDTTFLPEKSEYIPRRIIISCHNTACPSHTKEEEE